MFFRMPLAVTEIFMQIAVVQNHRPSEEQILETQARLLAAIKVCSGTTEALNICFSASILYFFTFHVPEIQLGGPVLALPNSRRTCPSHLESLCHVAIRMVPFTLMVLQELYDENCHLVGWENRQLEIR